MSDIVSDAVTKYVNAFSGQLDPLLSEIEHFTLTNHEHANMLSGAVQGKFLQIISKMLQPYAVLEIGTFTGYSALCLASGLHPHGRLHTIEIREKDAHIAKGYFERSGLNDKITLHLGNALEIIPALEIEWDLIFIDADKTNYINYYELTLPLLKPNGIILADNVLFHGQVLHDEIKGKNAKAIHAFNQHVFADERVEQVLLTIRDGITLIRKK